MGPSVPRKRRVNRPENEEVAAWLFLKHRSMAEQQPGGLPEHQARALSAAYRCVCATNVPIRTFGDLASLRGVHLLKDSLPGSTLDLPQESPPTFVSVAPSNLHQHLGDLLKTEKGADLVFEVDGHTFAAHRCVLAARSPVFSAELFGGMKEGNTAGAVRIDEMEAEVFKALLWFVYTDSLLVTEEEDEDVICQLLLVAADRYGMERLKSICEEKLCKFINAATIATILTLAEQHHCDGLKKACSRFLGFPANLRALLDSDGFDHLSRSCPSVAQNLVYSALVWWD
ncbi:unnamed protein product [Triticum turgidum subsp. durum]|uniref:BTB domain-containing protein n=1 Tax=Triticum turgidum subsp. durum TaxID=4567 RepID=A0A9R0VTI2_TRITD|nr:unnamed protein product [Triticum turgidum subsp. durum]